MMERRFLFCLVLLTIPALTVQTCPDGYNEVDGRCFFISGVGRSFENAKYDCMYRGGSLVVIDDAEDREDAMEGSSGPVSYWISRESEDVDFYSEPEDENCYICEAPPVCPVAGYVSYNGVCYKDFAELKTYDEARQTCAADGGLLAMPKDDATNTFIHNLGGGAAIRWIGLTDLGNEGQFVYEDGQSLASSGYSNWHPGEPNDAHQGEHCVMMFDTTHGWNDATCSLARGFICQLVNSGGPWTD